MAVIVSLQPVRREQRRLAERLWQLYTHDLSQFRGTMPDREGQYGVGRLPTYLDRPDRSGYIILRDGAVAGLALVRGLSSEPRVIGDFFVVRAARRQHVGHEAAMMLLGLRAGRWEVGFQESNLPAARFWRRVAQDAAGVWSEVKRQVPGKPDQPPDTWLLLST